MNFQQYIKPELLILIPVLYLIGKALKQSEFNNKFIPLILGAISVVLSGVYVFAIEPVTGAQGVATALFTAITQGILCAGASVYTNELITQAKKGD